MNKPDPCKNGGGWFHTVGRPATMSLYYQPFDQSRPPIQQKEATFHPMDFHFIDAVELAAAFKQGHGAPCSICVPMDTFSPSKWITMLCHFPSFTPTPSMQLATTLVMSKKCCWKVLGLTKHWPKAPFTKCCFVVNEASSCSFHFIACLSSCKHLATHQLSTISWDH